MITSSSHRARFVKQFHIFFPSNDLQTIELGSEDGHRMRKVVIETACADALQTSEGNGSVNKRIESAQHHEVISTSIRGYFKLTFLSTERRTKAVGDANSLH